jgi:ankyrin repeat protein
MYKPKFADETQYVRSRPQDKAYLTIPNLMENENNVPFIVAAFNGAIEKNIDSSDPSNKIISLKNLFSEKKLDLDVEAKQYIIPFLLGMENSSKRKIHNKYQVIKYLVEQGANGEDIIRSQFSDIHNPAFDIDTLKGLIEGGTNPNTNVGGYTALHAALMAVDHFTWKERVDYLLEKGVDPNIAESDRGYGTAFHMVLANENFNNKVRHVAAKYLISKLPNYNYNWNIQDGEGKTVLLMAAKMRATEVLQLILIQKDKYKLELDLNKQDKQGRTALHFCCALGDLEGVKLLITAKAATDITDNQGRTALQYAELDEDSIKCILKEIHIDPNRDEKALNNDIIGLDGNPIWKDGSSGEKIYIKAQKEYVAPMLPAIISQIENLAFDSEKKKNYDIGFIKIQCQLSGRKLITACIEGQQEVLNFFMAESEYSHLVANLQNLFVTQNPFNQLVKNTQAHVKKYPSDNPFLISIKDNQFSKALRQACCAGRIYLVEILFDYLISQKMLPLTRYIDDTSNNGRTALHWAAIAMNETGNGAIVQLLLERNANPMIRDKENKLYSDYLPKENYLIVQKSVTNS